MNFKIFLLLCFFVTISSRMFSDEISTEIKQKISIDITTLANRKTKVGDIKIDSISIDKKNISIYASNNLAYSLLDNNLIDSIYQIAKDELPDKYKKYKIQIYADQYNLDDYLLENRKDRFYHSNKIPLTTNLSKQNNISRGLNNKHIALWQSHGLYYDQSAQRWDWQRAKIFQTVEDLYTQSYVLPYLVPMLENAGANVLIPRERDTSVYEVIVDNDQPSEGGKYLEYGDSVWTTGENSGFANTKESYKEGENPFRMGTYRQASISNKTVGHLEWIPEIPKKGKYAVYVSYQSLPNSTEKAIYEIHHAGGVSRVSVNQTMGGGTWIYIGDYEFEKGSNASIILSNRGKERRKIITADAIKIGGGMGNIARKPQDESIDYVDYSTSGYPRFTEGARYWLQWAGVPDSIYSRTEGKNDYSDDFQSRGYWVNYLAGGSKTIPESEGLKIPIDLAFAFHSDAGTTFNDSIIGTLGICMTHINDEIFANSKPRILSRDLTSMIMDEVVGDIQTKYEPNWTRRPIWNKSYSEARVPEVPTMLLELLSHQNFADMKYGLDPNFQFDVSRAIYKGILKFIATQYKQKYVVQPLPIHSFSAVFTEANKVLLAWQPTIDSLESSAIPNAYIVYQRIDNKGFDNGTLVKGTQIELEIENDKIYSYKVEAVNDGGNSFPSEILSVGKKSNSKGLVLIINGFDRVSGPDYFSTNDSIAGFLDSSDHGVPYIKQYNYIGSQYQFRRDKEWLSNDNAGFGSSHNNYAGKVIAGNTFDYPLIHGQAILENGYSFVSSSREATSNGQIDINQYKLVDIILGKQKEIKIATSKQRKYEIFPLEFQKTITDYCKQGGNVFVSGSFIGSDLFYKENSSPSTRKFATEVLKYKFGANQASLNGEVKFVNSPFKIFEALNLQFNKEFNSNIYKVESPDAILPAGNDSYTIMRYSENGMSAGIASKANYKTCILGFPFETIIDKEHRTKMMNEILEFVFEKE